MMKHMWKGICVHHSASIDHPEFMQFDSIYDYHVTENMWADIGYHFLAERIDNRPVIIVGRGLDQAGSHCKGYNTHSIGICFVGNYEVHPVDDELVHIAIHRIIIPLCDIYGLMPNDIQPHQCYGTTLCPGKNMIAYLPEIQKEVARYL